MRRIGWMFLAAVAAAPLIALAAHAAGDGPNRVLQIAKVGGDGGFDYVNADVVDRRLYVARRGMPPVVHVFDLDTLKPVGDVADVSAHGAVADPKSGHGFASSKPITMFDAKTLMKIKDIQVDGNPDGMMFDAFNQRVYDWSHAVPHGTVIDAVTGNVLGTIDLGGAPEQSVSDGAGHIYVDVEDKGNVAVIDAKTMKVTAHYSLMGKGDQCAGLALDAKNHILFAACRDPQAMVILSADDGKILATLPLDGATDGATFNPATMEAFSSQGNGTLTVIKENSPTSFVVEQVVKTIDNGKTLTIDTKTGHVLIIGAEYGPVPAGAAQPKAGRAARGPMVDGSFSIVAVGH